MGVFAEALAEYARPLLDETDGSIEQLNKAFAISQLCYNLALMPEESRDRTLSDTRLSLKMDDEEFDNFRRSIVLPMIRRHREMFPQWQSVGSTDVSQSGSSFGARPRMVTPAEEHPRTDRYAPCPCNSGRKYKFCCGKRDL